MFNREGSRKLPLHVVRDNAKWVFLPTKIILLLSTCWPENRNSKLMAWLQYFCVSVYCFFLYGQLYFITHSNSDLTVNILTLTFFIVTIEVIARYHMMMTKREKLSNLLNVIYYDFWPSDAVGESVNNELLVSSRRIFFFSFIYTSAAVICALQNISYAVFFKHLSYRTTYPYDWRKSPNYELMLCFQSFFGMNNSLLFCGTGCLISCILSVLIAQFKLLKTYVRENIEAAILNDQKFETQHVKKMFEFALNHHNVLIKVSQDINDIFKYYILFEFLASIVTVCVSTFVIAVLPQERLIAVTYLLGHIVEIFIHCYLGNELFFESADLSDHIFHCGWHLADFDKDFQKSLMMGIMRSQKPIKIMAGGFGYLQLSAFLNLIKFAFSVYTLLQTLLEKQDGHI